MNAFSEARRGAPSLLYLPHLQSWWACATETMRMTLTTLLEDTPPDIPIMLIALADVPFKELDDEIAGLFQGEDQLCELGSLDHVERENFFNHVIQTTIERCQPTQKTRQCVRLNTYAGLHTGTAQLTRP